VTHVDVLSTVGSFVDLFLSSSCSVTEHVQNTKVHVRPTCYLLLRFLTTRVQLLKNLARDLRVAKWKEECCL
jgi:hypothetical protein